MTPELEPVPVSAINQHLYCERRCALIHVEGVFTENIHTLEGSLLHETADSPGVETRPGVRVARALPLRCRRLGLTGKADLVEFHALPQGGERPVPVDYKHGRRQQWDNDDAQLCAQALCLEEMFGAAVPSGAIYHAGSKRRREVVFTPNLRELTERTVEAVRALIRESRLPPAELKPQCEGCSLRAVCLPEASRPGAAQKYARALFDASA
ncbi:MAG: CRISPR-associated protein Cas4 [Elusimicrobia bacterium]|nr:CRISPR-associated protein Cas4 [Elusimicrobiota bacterium]